MSLYVLAHVQKQYHMGSVYPMIWQCLHYKAVRITLAVDRESNMKTICVDRYIHL